ncbi:lipoxygenase homology domain-containing protein 1 isoform X1 [Melanotaenia boesemani]|uniref:lipoxygenase homology domain-containing protein 1 isoform X1 n=1 Tax=Melanotaenia boesemani TaxID=1250792 RepID=UPI001C059539|nr:lipoxygenase homology domain-containing protein 1 isoform X1 [Melanotaenia boesemani]
MPIKKKKSQRAEEETKDVDDEDSEDQEPKPKKKSKRVRESKDPGKLKKKLKTSDEEGYNSDTSEPDLKITKRKGRQKEKTKDKKKKAKEGSEDELSCEDNNNESKGKKKREIFPDVIEITKKGSKKSSVKDRMGSKDKSKKEGDGDDEEGKKKKKEKKKKSSEKGGSDEDTKKSKGKKKKIENYVEIYENELRNYEPEKVENHEDEYHKKKVYEVVTITGDERGAGTDANVFVALFGEYGITPKVHLASNTEKKSRTAFEKAKTDVFRIRTHNVGPLKKIRIEHDNTGMNASWFLDRVVVTDVIRPHLRFYFACNNWLSKVEGDGLFVRDLLGSMDPMDMPKYNKYIVSVLTADLKGSGTDADVFINIFGEFGDSGERRLDSDKNNFEKGTEDKFTIDAPNLGKIRKITIGHNNKGSSAGWFVDKVTVDDMGNKIVYEFPVSRWFAIDEDDGKIQRDILVGGGQPTGIVYNVQVVTGNVRGAGTNSKIHIVMHGTKGMRNSGKVFLEGGKFERGLTDIFNVEIAALLSPLSRVAIGHDNDGVSPGWYCEKVVVYCTFTGIEQTFPCSKWLDEKEGDGLIERELYEMVSLRQKRQKKHPWSLWIWTSDLPNAGTDADISFQVYGDKGKSDEIRLDNKTDNFEQGQIDKFMVELPDLGKLTKLRIWHEKRNPFAGWHLSKVTLIKSLTKEKYTFPCERWLDINEDDNEVVKELPANGDSITEPLPLIKYRVTVCTGTISGSGTDASVFLNLIGDQGETGERQLINCKNNVNKFEKGNLDEFIIEAVALGQVRRVRIGHDGKGGGCGWFLDKVVVREEGQAEANAVEFPCDRWLDRSEDDGQIVRELVPFSDGQRLYNVSYYVLVKTGSIPGSSSNSNVFVKLYGEKGDTSKMMLVVSANNLGNYFEMGRVDIFVVETFDIGQINRLLIGHTNEGMRAGWFLDSVQIMIPVHGKNYMFPSHRWLCKDEADGKTEVELYPSEILDMDQLINYEITVVTGDAMFAGTNAKVFIQIYGDKGKTEVITLESRSNNYERNTTEIFKIEAKDVGKIFKIRIGHDGSGMGSGWFLETVDIKHLIMALVPKEKKKDDKKKKKKKKKDEDDDEDEGEEMQEVVLTYHFPCSRWLAGGEEDGELVVELLPEGEENLEVNTYEVCVFTGDMLGAGADAKVYINIYGENGDTGERYLRNSDNLNKFERGQEDVFIVTAVDLGPLKKLRIRHDNSNPYSSWYLDRVEIVDTMEDTTYYFPCNRWLAVDEDDGQIARELVPVDEAFMRQDEDEEGTSATLGLEQKSMSTTYTLKIKTGDKEYAGTDANVFAILFGEKDDTGIINLKACKNYKNKFEQGMINEFTVEAVDLGDLEKLRIGHDNSGGSAGWFLDWVEINAPSQGQRMRFPCGRWLDKVEDDGAIVRDLYPAELQTELYTPFVPYEIKIFTSDVFAAGTDADVFIVLYGTKGMCTQQKHLCVNKRERRLYFERGAEDMFIVELEDIGDVIEKIRIGHDNRGTNPGWHLDRVEIRRQLRKGKGSETTIFPCECWLAKSEDDGETVRELVPSSIITQKLLRDGTLKTTETEVEDALETHMYKVSVRTGDMYGAGTDANVFLTIYGDLGDTGERKLAKSENNRNKFERGEVDKFTIEAVDLGQVFKIHIRHDNSLVGADWYLDQVEVQDVDTEEVYMFLCERWLSTKKEDNQIERTFYVKGYEGERNTDPYFKKMAQSKLGLDRNANKKKKKKKVAVVEDGPIIPYHFSLSTGIDRDASTTARVYVIIIGPNDVETDRMWLDLPEGKKSFASGTMEHFVCYGTDVGEIKRVELGHNGVTPESCWLVDELSVAVPTKGIKYIFPCKCWLAKDRGDGLTTRLLNVLDSSTINIIRKVIYSVTVVTGDTQYAGTDTNILLTVYGANGSTEEILLPKNGDRFERGQEDTFALEIDDIAPLKKIRIRIDGSGSRPDWFFDRIIMRNLITEEEYLFAYENWLSNTKGPKRTKVCELAAVVDEEEMVEKTTYIIQVQTSDVGGAGTDTNVFLIVFGEYGDTGVLALKESTNRNKFERKMKDVFRFPDMLSLGELSKVRVWHDNKGPAAGWHLEYIDVKDEAMDQTFRFPCDRWLAKNEDDGQIMRELACANNDSVDLSDKTKYEIVTTTANTDDASTTENAWIVLEGRKARSKEFVLENKKKKFLCGATDTFEFSSKHLGDIVSICLGHITKDGKKVKNEAFWHLMEVVVTEKELGNKYFFHCDAQIPLAAKKDQFLTFECYKSIESFASKVRNLVPIKYEIIVITGDIKGGGTDANVFITLYGVNGDSGKRDLRQKFRNLFERGQTDRFVLEMLDLGELLRVKMEHDSTSSNCGWYLECVEVTNTANSVTTIFPCGKWLDASKADRQIQQVLYPRH